MNGANFKLFLPDICSDVGSLSFCVSVLTAIGKIFVYVSSLLAHFFPTPFLSYVFRLF